MDELINGLIEYIEEENSGRYAVALVGEWGSGKTRFCNTTLKQNIPKGKTLIRVSLFGIQSVDELYERMVTSLFHLNLGKNERLERAGSAIVKTVAEAIPSYILDRLKESGITVSLNPQLFSAFLNENTVIVFDDCERTSDKEIDINLLGAINDLIEGIGCKVIFVSNSIETISGDLREKVIWKTFHFSPDSRELFDEVLSDSLKRESVHDSAFIEACRKGADRAHCKNARALIKARHFLLMVLSSSALTLENYSQEEKASVVESCAYYAFLAASNKAPKIPDQEADSSEKIRARASFNEYKRIKVVEKCFVEQMQPTQAEIDEALSRYLDYKYPATPSDRKLKAILEKKSAILELDDTDVAKIVGELSRRMKEGPISNPTMLWSAVNLNACLLDLGFNEALSMDDAQELAETSIDSDPLSFCQALQHELEIETVTMQGEPRDFLKKLVAYAEKRNADSISRKWRMELDKTEATDRGSVLARIILDEQNSGRDVFTIFNTHEIADCFLEGNARSQSELMKMISSIENRSCLYDGSCEAAGWMVDLQEAFDDLEVNTRMGRKRLELTQETIRKINEMANPD